MLVCNLLPASFCQQAQCPAEQQKGEQMLSFFLWRKNAIHLQIFIKSKVLVAFKVRCFYNSD
jgi:hypothetical protein